MAKGSGYIVPPTRFIRTVSYVVQLYSDSCRGLTHGLTLQGHRDIGPLLPGGGGGRQAKTIDNLRGGIFPQAVSSPL
jgi:hypothetical protein